PPTPPIVTRSARRSVERRVRRGDRDASAATLARVCAQVKRKAEAIGGTSRRTSALERAHALLRIRQDGSVARVGAEALEEGVARREQRVVVEAARHRRLRPVNPRIDIAGEGEALRQEPAVLG